MQPIPGIIKYIFETEQGILSATILTSLLSYIH
ncbi:hypothetical protein AZE42_14020 [Rhizopogon vesiculosus]|uniref:Uncharacterized protein n=1 Tax=Rhizopogon vesiculosus TaxID=180088 RepID=A0A1J8RAG9_9AGAM|nr:hypothetical protein AZE42_14020 [Rhizopogon vesiculosus]